MKLVRDNECKIPSRHLLHVVSLLAEHLDLSLGETDVRPPSYQSYCRGHRPPRSDDVLDLDRRPDVARVGHAVAQDGALQRDNRLVRRQCLGNLRRNLVGRSHRSRLTRASSLEPTRATRGPLGISDLKGGRPLPLSDPSRRRTSRQLPTCYCLERSRSLKTAGEAKDSFSKGTGATMGGESYPKGTTERHGVGGASTKRRKPRSRDPRFD